MSSFLVSESTMAKIADAITYVVNTDKYYMNTEELKKALPDCIDKDGFMVTHFVAIKLYEMNDMALRARYRDEWWLEDLMEGDYKKFICNGNPFENEPLQLLKSIQCYLYQCREGNVPEMPLYKAIDEFASRIMSHIVCSLPEYEKAIWG